MMSPPDALSPHAGHRGPAGVDGAPEVHLHHAPEVLQRLLVEPPGKPHAGVVDEGVEAAEPLGRALDQSLHLRGVGDVGAHAERLPAPGLDLLDRTL